MLTVWRSKDKTTEKLSRAALAAEVFLQITPAGAHALCAKLELVNRPEESRRHEWERKNGASSVFSSELIISNIHWLKRNYVRHTEMLSCLSFSSCTALGIAFYAYWIETDHELYSKCWWNIFVMCHCRGGYTSMSIDAVVDLYLFVCVFFFLSFLKPSSFSLLRVEAARRQYQLQWSHLDVTAGSIFQAKCADLQSAVSRRGEGSCQCPFFVCKLCVRVLLLLSLPAASCPGVWQTDYAMLSGWFESGLVRFF